MDQTSSITRNPWVDDERSLGRIRSVLHLAERHRYLKTDGDECSDDLLSQSKCRSLSLINTLLELEKNKTSINRVDLEIQKRLLVKETKDITDIKNLEKKLDFINGLSTHLQSVVSRKEMLLEKLQKPHTGNYLKVEASYRVYAYQVIPQLVPVLSELSEHLDTIEWAAKATVFDEHFNGLLSDITKLLAKIHVNIRSLLQMRERVQEIHNYKLGHFGNH